VYLLRSLYFHQCFADLVFISSSSALPFGLLESARLVLPLLNHFLCLGLTQTLTAFMLCSQLFLLSSQCLGLLSLALCLPVCSLLFFPTQRLLPVELSLFGLPLGACLGVVFLLQYALPLPLLQ
jgi:hypothetical protein